MQDDEVGYRKPPKRFQYKKGVSGNPKGRPKRKPFSVVEVIIGVMDGQTKYRENGKTKAAPRRELSLRHYVHRALSGDVRSAGLLLKLLAHADRYGEINHRTVGIINWLPDYPGQTAVQKTSEFARSTAARARPKRRQTAESVTLPVVFRNENEP